MISSIISAAISALIATFVVMFIVNKNGNKPYFLKVNDMFTKKNFKESCAQFKTGRGTFVLLITFLASLIL